MIPHVGAEATDMVLPSAQGAVRVEAVVINMVSCFFIQTFFSNDDFEGDDIKPARRQQQRILPAVPRYLTRSQLNARSNIPSNHRSGSAIYLRVLGSTFQLRQLAQQLDFGLLWLEV